MLQGVGAALPLAPPLLPLVKQAVELDDPWPSHRGRDGCTSRAGGPVETQGDGLSQKDGGVGRGLWRGYGADDRGLLAGIVVDHRLHWHTRRRPHDDGGTTGAGSPAKTCAIRLSPWDRGAMDRGLLKGYVVV